MTQLGRHCPVIQTRTPSVDVMTFSSTSAWTLLEGGELDLAREAFTALRQQDESEALLGLITRARLERDRASLVAMLGDLARRPGSEAVMLKAAMAGLDLQPVPSCAWSVARAAGHALPGSAFESAHRALAARLVLRAPSARAMSCQLVRDVHELPLQLLHGVPVLLASICGQPPASFVLDTGASICVLTKRYAHRIGVRCLAGTEYELASPAGPLRASYARVSLEGGDGLRIEDVEVAVLDLPLPGIAGVLSPQALFQGHAIGLDFRALRLWVAKRAPEHADTLEAPLWFADGWPQLGALAVCGRARLFTVDTGADRTRVGTSYLALMGSGCHAPQHASHMLNAGGRSAASWQASIRLSLQLGGGEVQAEARTVVPSPKPTLLTDLPAHGMIGMDVCIGRRLCLDFERARLSLDPTAQLRPWPQGSSADFRVQATAIRGVAAVRETVSARIDEDVVLTLSIEVGGQPRRKVLLRMRDGWTARGTYLATRPVVPVDICEAELEAIWRQIFPPFKPAAGIPTVAWCDAQLHGRAVRCSQVEAPVVHGGAAARLRIIEAPDDPWRVCSAELFSEDGERLFQYCRVGFELQSRF
jgi:predicted aspartyl protease